MKKLLLSGVMVVAALTASASIWWADPGSVNSGESYSVAAEAGWSYSTELYLFKNGSPFAYGTDSWAYASGTTKDYGSQTVHYTADAYYNDGGGSNGPESSSLDVTVTSPAVSFRFFNLAHTYDGSPKTAGVEPTPGNATYDTDLTKGPDVGSYTVNAWATGNYTGSGSAELTIGPASTDFSLSSTSFTYNGGWQWPSIVPSASGATFNYGGAFAAFNAGTYTASATAYGNYTGSNNSLSWTINKADQTIAFAQPAAQTYGTLLTLGATASSGFGITYTYISGPATLTFGGVLNFNGVGPVVVRASQGGDINYNAAATVERTITVNKADQTITFAQPPAQTYNTSLTLGATTTSPLAVSYSIVSGPATLSGATVTFTGANPVTVRASQTGNANYNAAAVERTISVNKASQTITFAQPAAQTYNTSLTLGATSSSGLTVTYSVVAGPATVSGTTVTFTGANPVTVRASQVGNANYSAAPDVERTITVNKATQTITFSQPGPQTYGTPLSLAATASSGLAATYTIVSGFATVSGSVVTFSGTGNVTVRASQVGNANYNAAADVDRTFMVNPAPATFALSATSFTYTGSAQGPSVIPTPAGATFAAGGTLSAVNVNVNPYTATATANGNYTGSNPSLNWNINKANQTIAFVQPPAQTYGTPLTLGATASSGLAVSYSVISGPATISGSVVTFTGTSDVTVRASQAGNANYNAAADVNRTITVGKASQTITFTQPATQIYGTSLSLGATVNSPLTVGYSIVSGLATVSGNVVTFTGTGSVTVRASQAGNANYNAAADVDRTFGVNPQPATFALSAISFPYNGSTQGPTVVPTPSGATFTTTGPLSATALGNYTVTATATGNYVGSNMLPWSIAMNSQTIDFPQPPAQSCGIPLTLNATASSGLSVSYAIISGPATVSVNVVTFTAIGNVTVRASQAGDTNYSGAADVTRTFTVNMGDQTIIFDQPAAQIYDTTLILHATATPSGLPVTYSIVAGPATVAGDTVTFTGTGSVTARASQEGNTNYKAASPADRTFIVNKADQTITFPNPVPQTYGTPLPLGATASSGLAVIYSIISGPATVSGNVVSFTGIGNVTVRASQGGNGNYNAALPVDQTFLVNPAPTTFALSATAFTYNGTAQGPTIVPTPGSATFTTGGTLSAIAPGNYAGTATAFGNYIGSSLPLPWIINKATPAAVFPNRDRGTQTPTTYAVQPGDLNASFLRAGVGTPPTGIVTYSIISASGPGASPASGPVTGVTVFTIGTYTIRAVHPGDTNYNTTSVDAVWNIVLDVDADGIPGYIEVLLGLDPNVPNNQDDGSNQTKLNIHRPNQ